MIDDVDPPSHEASSFAKAMVDYDGGQAGRRGGGWSEGCES